MAMAYIDMAYIDMAYMTMAYIVTAYIVTAYIVTACIVMACIVMAPPISGSRRSPPKTPAPPSAPFVSWLAATSSPAATPVCRHA